MPNYTLYNLNANFTKRGFDSDETGIIVSSIKTTFTPKNDTLLDKQGRVTGLARLIDCTREIDVTGTVTNNTGLAATNISFVADVTIANKINEQGFTSGHPVFVEHKSYDEGNDKWKDVNIRAISYLGISS